MSDRRVLTDPCPCGEPWCTGCAEAREELAQLSAAEVDDAGPWVPARCPHCGQAAAVRTVGLREVARTGDGRLARSEWAGRANAEGSLEIGVFPEVPKLGGV